jgi:hypothetical protein
MMTESNMATMIATHNSDYYTRVEVEMDSPTDSDSVNFRPVDPNTITLYAGGSEMIRVAPDGFWVRGVSVPQNEQEAQAVYNAFKQWMAWASLQGNM